MQIARPTSDITVSGWTATPAGAVWPKLADSDDATFADSPSSTGFELLDLGLGPLTDPGTTLGHALKVRMAGVGGATVVQLGLNGQQWISDYIDVTEGALQDYEVTITFAEESFTIDDYGAITVEVIKVSSGSAEQLRVAEVSLTIPSPGGGESQEISLTGLPSAGAVGTLAWPQVIALDGVVSDGAVGVLTVEAEIVLSGVPSRSAVGSPAIVEAVTLTGVPSRSAVGYPWIGNADPSVYLSGVPSRGAVGVPSVAEGVQLTGVPSRSAVGALALSSLIRLGGVPSRFTMGTVLLTGGEQQYMGVIDDFRILATVPTDAQAAGNARRELDGDEAADTTTLCYLQFGEGTGATAFDSSGNARDAALVGTTQWVGFEGTPDLADTRKPLSWGIRRMRKGVLVDAQRNVFQLHNGQTHQIIPLENGLDSLTYDGDFANVYDWTPVAGHYATQLSRGLCRLNDLPDGVTMGFDVWGDVDPDGGYTDVTAEIMRNIAVHQGGLDGVEGIDTAAVAGVAAARPDAVGYSTGGAPVTILAVLNDLAGGADGWWTLWPRDGRFTMGVREEPGEPEFTLGVNDIVEDGMERIATASPVRQWTLSYAPFEVTLDLDAVAGAIPATERSRYTKELLYASSPDLGLDFVKQYADAVFATGDTQYDTVGACRRECARRAALDMYPRDVYKVTLPQGIFQFRVGQPGVIAFPRWRLQDGNRYLIGGHEEATDTGGVVLYAWGARI